MKVELNYYNSITDAVEDGIDIISNMSDFDVNSLRLCEIVDCMEYILTKYEETIEEENKIGFKNDKIFLLSIEEYDKYRSVIPGCKTCWWLRTHGMLSYYAFYVDYPGNTCRCGSDVDTICYGVRPVLKSDIFEEIGKQYIVNNFPFTCIDKNLGIATVPITFDKFDDKSNNYEKSYIREWLLNWLLNWYNKE